ncbi:hypothetical protein CL621_00110, partial [archaeon]|nr:hypothetical protein [archaeon]
LGTFNVILGHANVGKTYWVLWYFLALAIKHNIRFLIFSSENTVGGLKRNLMQLLAQKKLEEFTEHDYWKFKTQIEGWFKFIDTDHLYSYKDLLKTFEDNLNDFDCCLIDPYNSLVRATGMSGNQHEIDYQVASEFRIFCRLNNKTLYVNAHASTEALRKTYHKDHDLSGYPIPPNASDIEGGGKWVNRADDFIVIHRLTQHPQNWMNTEIHVKKVKESETGGTPTFMDEPVKFRLWGGCKFLCNNEQGEEVDVLSGNPQEELSNKTLEDARDDQVPF